MFLTTQQLAIAATIAPVTAGLAGAWLQSLRDDRRWERERDRERERWAREDDRQWISDRRHLYAKYMTEIDAIMTAIRRVLLKEEEGDRVDEALRANVTERRAQVRLLSTEVMLLAPEDLRQSVNETWDCLVPLMGIVQQGDLFEQRRELEAALAASTRTVFDLARRDLGLAPVWSGGGDQADTD